VPAPGCHKRVTSLPRSVRSKPTAQFSDEAELVRHLVHQLKANVGPWGRLQTLTEWDYRSGITDILARTSRNELIAFEAKLTDWRRALFQAYRNTAFALRAYVVLPEPAALRAQSHIQLFKMYGVGLCSCSLDDFSVRIEAQESEPLMAWLSSRAHMTFDRVFSDGTSRSNRRSRSRLQSA
jgi:hypothetical protein